MRYLNNNNSLQNDLGGRSLLASGNMSLFKKKKSDKINRKGKVSLLLLSKTDVIPRMSLRFLFPLPQKKTVIHS